MNILYRQNGVNEKNYSGFLAEFGITQCYLKEIKLDSEKNKILRKTHHHTGFEIHIVESGSQTYEVFGKRVELSGGEFLLIPPFLKHTAIGEAPNTVKYSITFGTTDGSVIHSACSGMEGYILAKIPERVSSCIAHVKDEGKKATSFAEISVSCRILDAILAIFSASGINGMNHGNKPDEEDVRLQLAKQYIKDNVTRDLTVPEVSAYVCISEKQLNRLFSEAEGIAVGKYIREKRASYVEELLSDPALTLKEISEVMDFSSEYYFNTFFKKHAGITPGAYRKSINLKG